jgi:hypothetical protein
MRASAEASSAAVASASSAGSTSTISRWGSWLLSAVVFLVVGGWPTLNAGEGAQSGWVVSPFTD